eukprot:GILI01013014.1.p1 GENE.GILI01013014.1~~GILI01013014.1.p1  ORF type:complete len:486 (-),score=96.48 GILI01013014.1:69-1472(-)
MGGGGGPPPMMMDTMNLPGMNPTPQQGGYSNNRYEGNHYNNFNGGAGTGAGGPPMYGQGPPQYGGGGGGYRGRGGGGYRGRGRGMGDSGYGAGGDPAMLSGFGGNPLAGLANPLDANDPRNRCNFFHKMGACRHGDNCTKFHVRPPNGQTVLFPKMFPNPQAIDYLTDREWPFQFDKKYLKKYFHNFYKNVWRTFMKVGRIVELRVVSNLCEHLVGNVYIKFAESETAIKVCESLLHRKYLDILLLPEMTPVSDFNEACCKEDRDAEVGCDRKLQCNFLHLMKVSREVMEKLIKEQDEYWEVKDKAARAQREKEALKEKEKADKRAKEKEREAATSSHREDRDKQDRDKRDKHDREDRDKRDKRDDRDKRDKREDRDKREKRDDRDKRDKRDDRDRRHRDRSRDRRRDYSRDRHRDRSADRDRDRDRDRERREARKRDRSPGTVDERLCMVCGEKGHISKDCPQLRS